MGTPVNPRKITKLDRETGEPVDAVPLFIAEEPGELHEPEGEPLVPGRRVQQAYELGADAGAEYVASYSVGVWVAYRDDWSALMLYRQELDALRFAVKSGMQVGYAPFGEDLFEWAIKRVTGE